MLGWFRSKVLDFREAQLRLTQRRYAQSLRREKEANKKIAELTMAVEELTKIATIDSLTGLLNLHGGNEALTTSIAEACRTSSGLGIAMIDLDNFKRLNDTQGHAAGDELLKSFGALLKNFLRAGDAKVRKGGDEFLVLFKNTGSEAFLHTELERIRKKVEEQFQPLGITASIGGVFFDPANLEIKGGLPLSCSPVAGLAKGASYAETGIYLVELADKALYKSKEAGRNAVHIASITSQAKRDIAAALPSPATRRNPMLE